MCVCLCMYMYLCVCVYAFANELLRESHIQANEIPFFQ